MLNRRTAIRFVWMGLLALVVTLLPVGAISLIGSGIHLQPSPGDSAMAISPIAALKQAAGAGPNSEAEVERKVEPQPIIPSYVPPQINVPAHPTNYGERYLVDVNGYPVHNEMIVVIHETVGSASSALNMFQVAHYRDSDQVSYHSLIRRDGTIVYIVPPAMRAFGAGNSVFDGPNGPETVRTNAAFPPSVNNFAYHTSLESPADGRGNSSRHSGYTDAQYRSLAWLLAQLNVPESRITTHQGVDRSGTRRDPRSFDPQRFLALMRTYQTASLPSS